MKRYAFFGERQPDGRVMVVIVQAIDGTKTGEVIDACLCCGDDQAAYLDKWLGPDRPKAPVYVKRIH